MHLKTCGFNFYRLPTRVELFEKIVNLIIYDSDQTEIDCACDWFRTHGLTVENYAGVGHPHGVGGDAGVVAVVAFRDVEEDEHRLFALVLDLDAV